jgi:LPS-assembly protein
MLTGQNVFFAVKDIPVLYLPYIALPILQDRQSGFLIPRIGYNTGQGLKINNAFFWAISESQDATIYADYYGKKGWGSGLEYRYMLSQDTHGQFNGYYINDIQLDRSRWDIKYNHSQLLSEDLSAKLRVNYLNDKTLFKDISEDIGERLQRTQDSDLYVNQRWDALSMHLWGQYTQNLSGKSDGIFQRLPEAGIRVMDMRISDLPVYWNMTSSASRWEEIHTGLTRLHLEPKMSARLFETTGLIFIPEVGTEQTLYYRDGDNNPARSSLYDLAASLSTKFYRSFASGSGHIEHFIEPSIRYEYAEGSSVGTPPLLDPVEKDTEKNLLSFSLLNRIVSPANDGGYEPFYLRLTQMYRITSPPLPNPPSGFSDLRLEAIIRLHKLFSIDTDTTYNYKEHSIKSAGTDVTFTGDRAHLTLGQRYSEDPAIRFLTASTGIRVYKTDASMDFWYDDRDHILREADYSLKYNFQCWGVTLSYRFKPEEEQFNILLTLKGLGSV